MKVMFISAVHLLLLYATVESQDSLTYNSEGSQERIFGGFVRGGFYTWVDKSDDKIYIPSAFTDIGLKLETGNRSNFRAYADFRYRYGTEFGEPVSRFDLREAWVSLYGNKWSVDAGQKIIKWGRCDFTNPTSRLSPQNLVLRSPDREEINMGNLLASVKYSPIQKVELQAVVVPFYRPSVLVIDPFPLPENVVINELTTLITDKSMISYGLKTDFHFNRIDWSISWFDGQDPMPGIGLEEFTLDLSQQIPVPYTVLSEKPYKNRVIGIDFETTAGAFGLRGESAWALPQLSYTTNEYVPLPEIRWVAGIDWSSGIWRLTGEYSGKYITDFTQALTGPSISDNIDFAKLAPLLAIPGFDPEEFVRQQVAAFNRLYNYQLEEYYHSACFRVEADFLYGRILPSIFTMYNITSADLLIIPEVILKPSDGISISIGAELYSGKKNSLFDLIDDFMNGAYISMRVNF